MKGIHYPYDPYYPLNLQAFHLACQQGVSQLAGPSPRLCKRVAKGFRMKFPQVRYQKADTLIDAAVLRGFLPLTLRTSIPQNSPTAAS